MSIYKKYTVRELQLIEKQSYDVYIAVYGLRYHVQTVATSEKEAEKNAIYRLGEALFPGKSKAARLLDIKANKPMIHYRRPENWDVRTIKEIN